MSNSVINFMNIPNKISILKQLNCDEKYILDNASEFELFALWEGILPLVAGHTELLNYSAELGGVGLSFPEYGEERDDIFKRWRVATEGNRYDVDEVTPSSVRCPLKCGIYPEKPRLLQAVDMENIVSKNIILCDGFATLSETVRNEVRIGCNADKCMCIDISGIEYHRPDPHSAHVAYKKKISGEKLNCREEFIIKSELLIDMLTSGGTPYSIRLKTGGELVCAAALVTYICDRGFPVDKVFVDVTAESDMRVLSALVERVYPKIPIYPVMTSRKNMAEANELVKIFGEYPVGAFLVDEDIGSALDDALEKICDNSEHLDFLQGALR